jgi:glycosyltransferase involved in cell wall biosynthesis
MSGTGLAVDLVFPRFKLLSGAERLALELAGALADAGHRPRIVCHQFDPSCDELVRPGVEVVTTGHKLDWFGNRYLNAAFDYVAAKRLSDWLDPAADAAVLFGPALRLAKRASGPGRAVVYHCFEPPRALYQDRDDVLARAGRGRFLLGPALSVYRALDRRLVRIPGAITASGPYAAARIKAVYGRDAVPITHGIDRDVLDAHSGDPDRVDLVTVNYLHPRKRVDLALRALARLDAPLGASTQPPSLRIIGDGPERPALEDLARELGVESRVHFAGFVVGEELGTYYRAAKCYLHTAREESFGLSIIEAAYCGLPAVAVAEGGVVDNVIEGETGTLADATPSSVATGIQRLLGDADRVQALGQAARSMVDARYRWEHGGEDLLSAIHSAQ